MTTALALLAALAGATCTALAGAFQHRAAVRGRPVAPGLDHGHGLLAFARHQLGQRIWWTSLAIQAASMTLHATALHLGSLPLVQPVTATVVVLALPLNHWMNGSRITRSELCWAGVVTVGLIGFLLSAAPVPSPTAPSGHALLVLVGCTVAVVAVCWFVSRRLGPRAAAVTLGIAAGLAFSLEAVWLLAVAGQVVRDPLGLLGLLATPALYALVATGAVGVALTQLSYRAGPMSSALPAALTVNALAGVVIGVLVVGDRIHTAPVALVIGTLSFVVLATAIAVLAALPEAVPPAAAAPEQ